MQLSGESNEKDESVNVIGTTEISLDDMKMNAKRIFLDWANENSCPIPSFGDNDDNRSNEEDDLFDLETISKSIGNAKVVVLSEGFHNCREMMLLHHRIIRYLVENCGFNTVASESGLPESRAIFEHVQGAVDNTSDTQRMWKEGLNKMYSEWREGRDLIEWMRDYNRSHDNVLQYYGVDIGGFYENWKAPLGKVIDYLDSVDSDYGRTFSSQLQPFFEVMEQNARINYSEKLTALQQAQLGLILDGAIQNFDTKASDYIRRSNENNFQWARQSIISMQLAENYYRNYLHRCHPESSKYVGLNGREIAMHRNILWIMKQRSDAKIILINHVIHTKTQTQYQDSVWGHFTPAGQMLRQSLGRDMYIIGMAYGRGKYWNKWQTPKKRAIMPIPPSPEDGLERTLATLGRGQLFIPWEKAPAGAQLWMDSMSSMRENDYFIKIKPSEWDACIYLDNVGPAKPARH